MVDREKLIARLRGHVYQNWADLYVLEAELKAIEQEHPLDEPEVIAALAWFANTAPVQARLAPRVPAALLAGLGRVIDDAALPAEARPFVATLFQQAALAAPEAIASLSDGPRARAERLLVECGARLPPATWASPWPQPGGKKKPRAARPPIPELPQHTERFALTEPLLPRTDTAGDAEAAAEWARAVWSDKRPLFALHRMSDAAAKDLWKALEAAATWSWNDLLTLVPRMGVEGLTTSLRLVAVHPSELAALAELDSPRAAPLMAAGLAGRPAQRTVARAWFARFPETAALGLVPLVLAGDRAVVQRALEALAHLRRLHPEGLAKGLERYEPEVRDAVREAMERGAELPARRPALPDFAQPSRLPRPITFDGQTALGGDALAELVMLLKVTPLGGAPWLDDVRHAFTAASLTRLARGLAEGWLAAEAPPKERWALQALAHFPDDAAARMLADLAAQLAPRGLSSRAQEMVEVLAAMQTRTGLALVNELSRKVRSRAFRARAELVFKTAAEKMGLSEDELAERLVPDFGLTPEGVLPVEPRLRLELDGLKPRYVDADGKVVKKLPEPADEELRAQLAELKKRAPTLVKEAAERLERALATGRRMSLEHFTELYLQHGLLRPLAAGLVWGVYGAKGALEETFVPGARGPESIDGAPTPLPEGKTLGVVHPLELSEELKVRWAQRLPHQPLEQLARRTQAFDSVNAFGRGGRRFVGRTVPAGTLLGLEKRGWQRGPTEDGGCFLTSARPSASGRVEIEFEPGVYLGDPSTSPEQRLTAVHVQLAETASKRELSELEHALHDAFGD